MWTMRSSIYDHESVMSVELKRRGPGRPRDLVKLQAILDEAYVLFLERGIAATTMDAVAERACVSKMTVYANFRDKPALVAAVFDRRIKAEPVLDLSVGADLSSSLERLIEFGELIASGCNRPEVIRMHRLMEEGADQHRRLAATFYAAGLGKMVQRVAIFLKDLSARGFLSISEPELAADQLVASWLGMSWRRQSLGIAGPPSPDEIAKRVRYAVGTLVRAWSAGRRVGRAENLAGGRKSHVFTE
jgi:TetR/AcrR family transcriptional regulator, mexJK operon transcriptional repressor